MKALWLNFLSALFAILGLAFVFILGESGTTIISYILPIAAGGFIYIATGDLIPELQRTKGGKFFGLQVIMLLIGVGAMIALTLLE
jgi:zinc and cadmium transporter